MCHRFRSLPVLAASTPLGLALSLAMGCAAPPVSEPLPRWSFHPGMVFPADRSLARPEDGIVRQDGKLIVADQDHGLRLVEGDGCSRPFGGLREAGYANDPPGRHGAPNGVSLEPDGEHLLVADVIGGGIFRVDVESGATQLVYRHTFGVNTAVRDSSGTIWFSQSARNTEQQGEMGVFLPVDVPVAEGALWRLPSQEGRFAAEAELVRDGLHYANGVAVDEARGALYLSELNADRVLRFPLDVRRGELGLPTTLCEVPTPDNLELDRDGRLWIVSPIGNAVFLTDPDTGELHTVFRHQSAAQVELADEFLRRGRAATPRLELISPAMTEPLPGFLTGIVLGAPDGSVHVSGLGDALLRLEPAARVDDHGLTALGTRYAAAWSSQRPEDLAACYTEGGSLVVNGGQPAVGRAAIAAKAREFMQAFPDMVVEMDSVSGDGRRATFHWTWTGTNTGPGGTGHSVRISGHEQWTLAPGGLIAESLGHYDEAEYARQVGGGSTER